MPLTDERLSEISDMLPVCRVIADIGADHGRLGAHLIKTRKCEKVWFSDISAPSLDKARALVKRLSLDEYAEFYVGDGAFALPSAPDAAVMAGMGGTTIARIVKSGREILQNAKLVMEPNVGAGELRKCLSESGFRITEERIVRAARRWYVLISAEAGEARYSQEELIVGPRLLQGGGEMLKQYSAFRLRVAEKALFGARKSINADTESLEKEAAVWKEICQ